MTHILLIDDHSVVREGVRRLLSNREGVSLHEEANSENALRTLKTSDFDIIILDLKSPRLGGLEALKRFRQAAPNTAILVFSMHDEPIYAARAFEMGAKGYVSKGAPPEEILTAIDLVSRNRTYIEKAIESEMRDKAETNADFLRPLTRRDLEILRLLAKGDTLSEIAATLGIAYKTVSNTCVRLRDKMGARSTIELVIALKRLDLV